MVENVLNLLFLFKKNNLICIYVHIHYFNYITWYYFKMVQILNWLDWLNCMGWFIKKIEREIYGKIYKLLEG